MNVYTQKEKKIHMQFCDFTRISEVKGQCVGILGKGDYQSKVGSLIASRLELERFDIKCLNIIFIYWWKIKWRT